MRDKILDEILSVDELLWESANIGFEFTHNNIRVRLTYNDKDKWFLIVRDIRWDSADGPIYIHCDDRLIELAKRLEAKENNHRVITEQERLESVYNELHTN